MKRSIALGIIAMAVLSCSGNKLDPSKYYVITETTPLVDAESVDSRGSGQIVEAGAKVMLLQERVTASDGGSVRIVNEEGDTFGIVKVNRLRITEEAIEFPPDLVFNNNISEIIYVKDFNSPCVWTSQDEYELECVFPAGACRMEIRKKNKALIHDAKLDDYYGYKYYACVIDLRPFDFGYTELSVLAYDKRDKAIGTRELAIRKDDKATDKILRQ